jgi:Immunoglobulin domain
MAGSIRAFHTTASESELVNSWSFQQFLMVFFSHRVSHSAKVNIYGQPYIREMPKITGISGSDLVIKCPVAGYPIDKIQWERDGQTLPLNRRQRAYQNGTLVIEQLQRTEDAGTYTCMAQNKQKQTARRNVEVQVLGRLRLFSQRANRISKVYRLQFPQKSCPSRQ